MRTLKVFALLAIAAGLVIGCTDGAVAVSSVRGGTVNANVTDMKIAVERNSISAGPVTFMVKNNGAVAHGLIVIPADAAHDQLPSGAAAGTVDATGYIGQSGDMDPGESRTFTVTLPAGHYVLFCNQVGHYAAGMHIAFTVN